MRLRPALLMTLTAVLMQAGCSDPKLISPVPIDRRLFDGGTADVDGDVSGFPDVGVEAQGLRILRLSPPHGPFSGGNEAVVRGSGFTDNSDVLIGGRLVQPADIEFIDTHRLNVVIPAGEPGMVDVVVRAGGDEATLEGGYTYDSIAIAPDSGSVSGGTLLDITSNGVTFVDGDRLFLGDLACDDLTVVSTSRMSCRTPPGRVGEVDVTLERTDGADIVLEDGYLYVDTSDPFRGGLGGGPMMGTINVTVIDYDTGAPVVGAFAILGEDIQTEHQGYTNATGQLAFSGGDLFGRHTIHVAKHCYEKTSIVSFDAQDVTVFLAPWHDLACATPGSGLPPTGRGRYGAFIEGELLWPGDFGAEAIVPWDNIPEPLAGETRVAYVFTTQRCPGDSPLCVNPPPNAGDSIQRVLEINVGERGGYPYRIFARPAGLAVYAIAGVENIRSRDFTPYVMGVARNVFAGPGETVSAIDIMMNIPLDHRLDVRLEDLPSATWNGPERFAVEADIHLGGEGVIVRRVNGQALDAIVRRTEDTQFRFFAQPALVGTLSDGRYRIDAAWVTGDFQAEPLTRVIRNGIPNTGEEILIDGFLGIPAPVAPTLGQDLPPDRILRWQADGAPPSFYYVRMTGEDNNRAWRHFVPGNVLEAPIPDLSTFEDVDDITPGQISWAIYAIEIPGFNFDELSYGDLNQNLWSAYALDRFTSYLAP